MRRGLLLRLVLAVVLHFTVDESVFAPDQWTYDWVGSQLVAYWSGERLTPPGMAVAPGPKAYFYIVGGLYAVLGVWALIPKLLNALIGARTIPLVYQITMRLTGDEATALRAATYTAFFPSLILWSVLNLRDAWIVFLIFFICAKALELQEGFGVRALVWLLLALALLTQFRDYIFFAIALPMVLSFFVRNRGNLLRNVSLGMILAVAVIYVDRSAGTERVMRTPDLETLQEYREFTGIGGSQFESKADISTPMRALTFLPKGIAYFLLAPFPWQIANFRQGFTLPEMLFFYSLILPILRGVRWLLLNRLQASLMIVLIAGGLTLGYALGQANVGTAYRYRAQVLPAYLIFAAVGVELGRRSQAVRAGVPQRPARVVA